SRVPRWEAELGCRSRCLRCRSGFRAEVADRAAEEFQAAVVLAAVARAGSDLAARQPRRETSSLLAGALALSPRSTPEQMTASAIRFRRIFSAMTACTLASAITASQVP